MPAAEFWPTSPRTFLAILAEAKRAEHTRETRADLRAGLLAAILCNVNAKEGAKTLGPEDFFPGVSELLEGGAAEFDEAGIHALGAHFKAALDAS